MTLPPPGWYPDPMIPSTLRYWDGTAWTPHQHATVSPFDAATLRAPAGTGWNTVWIWLTVLIPVVPMIFLLFVPWDSMFAFDPYETDPATILESQLTLYSSPFLWVSQLLGYAAYGLGVLFAYFDHRELRRRQVPKPFHWGWAFLNPVYPIGRSVVVKRRTGRGLAPMWVAIGTIAFSLIVSAVIVGMLFAGFADMMEDILRSYPSSYPS